MESATETEPEVVEVDAEAIFMLIDGLRQRDVHSFQGCGITVVFNEREEYTGLSPKAKANSVEDDGHSTSNRPVDGFRHPALYQWQNGKVLKFDGSLE